MEVAEECRSFKLIKDENEAKLSKSVLTPMSEMFDDKEVIGWGSSHPWSSTVYKVIAKLMTGFWKDIERKEKNFGVNEGIFTHDWFVMKHLSRNGLIVEYTRDPVRKERPKECERFYRNSGIQRG